MHDGLMRSPEVPCPMTMHDLDSILWQLVIEKNARTLKSRRNSPKHVCPTSYFYIAILSLRLDQICILG